MAKKFKICIYAQKLLHKITELNNRIKGLQAAVDIAEVKKAIYYAKKIYASIWRPVLFPTYRSCLYARGIYRDIFCSMPELMY